MKKILLIAAGLALLAGPALAQTKTAQNQQNGMKAQAQSEQKSPPRLFVGQGITDGNAVYDCTGRYMGSDPDPNIRARLLKEGEEDACKY